MSILILTILGHYEKKIGWIIEIPLKMCLCKDGIWLYIEMASLGKRTLLIITLCINIFYISTIQVNG